MPAIKETTVYDMKTNFSKYAADLLDGTYDEIVVRRRSVPTLRILPYEPRERGGIQLGTSVRHGHAVVSDDWGINDGDAEIAAAFDEAIR